MTTGNTFLPYTNPNSTINKIDTEVIAMERSALTQAGMNLIDFTHLKGANTENEMAIALKEILEFMTNRNYQLTDVESDELSMYTSRIMLTPKEDCKEAKQYIKEIFNKNLPDPFLKNFAYSSRLLPY